MKSPTRIVGAWPVVSVIAAVLGPTAGCGHSASPASTTASPPAAEGPMSSVGTVALSIVDDARRDRVDAGRPRAWIAQLYYPIAPARVTGVYADDPVLLDLLIAEKYYFASEPQL